MTYLLALLLSFHAMADFIWDELPKELPRHENFKATARNGLSVFWWNTQMGELNQEIFKARKFYPLDVNLKELTQHQYLPDVLLLGEYNEKNFTASTITNLKKIYKYHTVVENNAVSHKNIAIFSRFAAKIGQQNLLWYASEKQKLQYEKIFSQHKFFDRQFIHLEILKNNRTYHLIPAHLLNQWADLQVYYQKLLGKNLGKIKLGEEMLEGIFNPLMYQLRDLKSKISKNVPFPHTIVGDMNCPSDLYGIPTSCHQALKGFLRDSMSSDQASFPARSSSSYNQFPPMKIDHAVHSKKLLMKYPRVLPLLGSDHYPLLFIIQGQI